jgi:hypothetical protein
MLRFPGPPAPCIWTARDDFFTGSEILARLGGAMAGLAAAQAQAASWGGLDGGGELDGAECAAGLGRTCRNEEIDQ